MVEVKLLIKKTIETNNFNNEFKYNREVAKASKIQWKWRKLSGSNRRNLFVCFWKKAESSKGTYQRKVMSSDIIIKKNKIK